MYSKSGLVHTVKVITANVHDVTVTADLLTGEEAVYGDSGYLGADRRLKVPKKKKADKRIRFKLNRRPSAS